jgi:hypothetical protein
VLRRYVVCWLHFCTFAIIHLFIYSFLQIVLCLVLSLLVNTFLQLSRSVAGFPPLGTGFNPVPVHVGFLVDKIALGRFYVRVLRLSPVSITPPMLHIHSSIATAIINVATDSVVKLRVSHAFPLISPLPEITIKSPLGVPCPGRWRVVMLLCFENLNIVR